MPLMTSSAVMSLARLVADELAERADALGQRGAQAGFVGAAVGGRDGVAVIAFAAVANRAARRPPIRRCPGALRRKSWRPVKGWLVTAGRSPSCSARWSARPLANWKTAFSGTSAEASAGRSASGSDPREEIGLGAGEGVEARRVERRVGAENLRVGREGDGGAAPVWRGADLFSFEVGEALSRRSAGRGSCPARPRRWSRSRAR